MKTMRSISCVIASVLVIVTVAAAEEIGCDIAPITIDTEWADMKTGCTKMVRDQVQMELKAAMTYLSMAAHFSEDSVNRPGFADKFFSAAGEEREHAMKLISYLLMRGELVVDIRKLIVDPKPYDHTWSTGLHALKTALALEKKVTDSILSIIRKCENVDGFNDYHVVDYLTNEFLDEQYKGQRELAGEIESLGKMMRANVDNDALAEFLYDKKIMS